LTLWENDLKAQIREHLEEKHPHQDTYMVVESFDLKLARDISGRESVARNQSYGVGI